MSSSIVIGLRSVHVTKRPNLWGGVPAAKSENAQAHCAVGRCSGSLRFWSVSHRTGDVAVGMGGFYVNKVGV